MVYTKSLFASATFHLRPYFHIKCNFYYFGYIIYIYIYFHVHRINSVVKAGFVEL